MTDFHRRFRNWTRAQDVIELERTRIAFLNEPLPPNPPELLKLVSVRVVRSFCILGKPLLPDSVVEVEAHLAHGLAAIGKAELL